MWRYIEADFQREYGIDLVRADMSWRRFCVLYNGLSQRSETCRNYDRIAKKEGLQNTAAEASAWDALTGLQKPRG